MRHRQLSNSFTRFGIDQQDSNHPPVEHSYFPTGRPVAPENSPYVGQINHHHHHHMSRGGGVAHRLNLEVGGGSSRVNEYSQPHSSNMTMEVVHQPLAPPFPHPSITENRSLPPGGHGPGPGPAHYTNYNVPNAAHDVEAGPLNHHPTGKRKRSGSLNSLYTAGNSSGSSSQILPMEKQTMDCQTQTQTPPPFRGSLTIDGPDSSRNVRRRYTSRHDDMEPSSSSSITRTHVPNHFYQSTPHPPNYSAPVPHYPAPSHLRLPPPDISGPRHEVAQFHAGDSVFSRPPASQNLHGHHHHHHHHASHARRLQSSYGNGSRYSHYAHGGTSSTNGMRTPPESFSSRNSRHCSPGGWRGSYRSGRPRIAVERFHSVVDVTESHNRIGHEGLMMVDRASFYGSNSRNFSDQYRDLRLDIDNMSYEELLNLEERIGSVNTGLSEDSMSKCLREQVYYSSDQNHEEVSCPICLEEYENGDNIGRMEKCGHEYHVDCIKKWLMMKKLCPICKTECSTDEEPTEG